MSVQLAAGNDDAAVRTRLDRQAASELRDALSDALHDMALATCARERRESFERIQEEMRDAGDEGTGCYFSHPDVRYVQADQIASKFQELNAAGVEQFMVLRDPCSDVVAGDHSHWDMQPVG